MIALVVGEAFGQQIARALDLSGPFQAPYPAGTLADHRARAPARLGVPLLGRAERGSTAHVDHTGGALFTAAWLLATYLFSLFVANVASYGVTYGTLAGVAVLMIWLYLSPLVLLLGAELNAIVERLDPRGMQRQRQRQRRERSVEARQQQASAA